MAVTSIWPIKGRVDKVINYARNPEKTREETRKGLSTLHEIEGVIEYAADEMKTETRAYSEERRTCQKIRGRTAQICADFHPAAESGKRYRKEEYRGTKSEHPY